MSEKGKYAPEPPHSSGLILGWILIYLICMVLINSGPEKPGLLAWILHGITGEWAGWFVIPFTGTFYAVGTLMLLVLTIVMVGYAMLVSRWGGSLLLTVVIVTFWYHDTTRDIWYQTGKNVIEWTGTTVPEKLHINRLPTWER